MNQSYRYSLKTNAFYSALKKKNITIKEVATSLRMPIKHIKYKLRNNEWFCKEHIQIMTHVFGARTMFDIIYFPDKKFRKQVYIKTFLRGKGGGKRI